MDELQISGKRYISSRRIAKEHGYTADYVGQLIRGGKVAGQKVGRAWYVDAASFDAYLGTETAGQSAPEPVVEVKAPAPVVEELVLTPTPKVVVKAEPEPQPEEIVISKKQQSLIPESPKVEESVRQVALHVYKKEIVEEEKPVAVANTLHYVADDEPSLPEIPLSKKESRMAVTRAPVVQSEDTPFVPAVQRGFRPLRFVALAGLGVVVLAASALLSSAVSVNLNIEAGNAATVSYSFQW